MNKPSREAQAGIAASTCILIAGLAGWGYVIYLAGKLLAQYR